MFRTHVQVSADYALKRLDPELNPKVFLVGIRQAGKKVPFPACVEPEKEHWIESEAFDSVQKIAASIQPTYVESQMRQSHPLAQQRQDDYLQRRSLRDAILVTIDKHPGNERDRAFMLRFHNR